MSRLIDEAIVINHNIRIVIVSIHGDKVKLGIEAPLDIPVHREEIELAIQGEEGETP